MYESNWHNTDLNIKPKPRLKTRRIENPLEIRTFFDQVAENYVEFHGKADRLLSYRLSIVRRLLQSVKRGSLLEIGCGTGLHLFELTDCFEFLVGTDLSTNMIREAKKKWLQHPAKNRILLSVDAAEKLSTIAESCIDAVLCIGTLEHIPDKPAVLKQLHRVLKPNGAFICLTPNGSYFWYTHLAPWLGLDTQHLSSDVFLTRMELLKLINQNGFEKLDEGLWRFIPKGDMSLWIGHMLFICDFIGQLIGLPHLRGGLYIKAVNKK